jgi:hypothetical protein
MKKARAFSTTCISALVAAVAPPVLAPAMAQVPGPDACFTRSYDDAHLARHPGQGVRALRLWFHDAMRGDPETRTVIVEAVLADQGQARADGVGGQTLRQTSFCTPENGGTCLVECDGGWFTTAPRPDGGLEIVTERYLIGEGEGCGGTTDLSEGGRTAYRLDAAPPAACADLAHAHPLPEPGCYGVRPPPGDAGGVAGLTLRLSAPDLAGAQPAFPWLEGVLEVDLTGAAAPGPPAWLLAGQRILVPVWCASSDGICRSGMDEGGWSVGTEGGAVTLTSSFFALYDADGDMADITGGIPVRHVLSAQPAAACAGLVLE